MSTVSSFPKSFSVRPRAIRIGYLTLTDAAPFIVAQEKGFFKQVGLRVILTQEAGWATIRDKILYGELDAAQALAPLLWATRLGLESAPRPVIAGMIMNLNGNAITLRNDLRDRETGKLVNLRHEVRTRRGEERLTFGIVATYSSHHLMLREWLRGEGIDPDVDVRIVVVPPAQVFRNLKAGTIHGYCVGEPWNSAAVQAGLGWCPTWSACAPLPQVEKVLMSTESFVEHWTQEHAAMIHALRHACAWCDAPRNRTSLLRLLSAPRYLNLPSAILKPALNGTFDAGNGPIEPQKDFLIFSRCDANRPTEHRARVIQETMIQQGLLHADSLPTDLPALLFRDDLFAASGTMQLATSLS